MGRPPIDPLPYLDKLDQAILLGATYKLAALYAGISEDTFLRWRKRMGMAKPGTPLAQLRDRLDAAESRAALRWLGLIAKAGEQDWRALAWLLERRYPEMYGRTMQKVALTTPDGEQPRELSVIYLPSKAPSAEVWAEDVKQLAPQYRGNGAAS